MGAQERPDYVELVRRRGLLEEEQVVSYGGKFGTLTEVYWHRDWVTPHAAELAQPHRPRGRGHALGER